MHKDIQTYHDWCYIQKIISNFLRQGSGKSEMGTLAIGIRHLRWRTAVFVKNCFQVQDVGDLRYGHVWILVCTYTT